MAAMTYAPMVRAGTLVGGPYAAPQHMPAQRYAPARQGTILTPQQLPVWQEVAPPVQTLSGPPIQTPSGTFLVVPPTLNLQPWPEAARQGPVSLPDGWIAQSDGSGRVFYIHTATGMSQLAMPTSADPQARPPQPTLIRQATLLPPQILAEVPRVCMEHANRGVGSRDAASRLRAAIGGAPGKLVAFDFDKTIMGVHMFGKYQHAPVESIPVTDDMFADLPRFRGIVRACAVHGHRVAVVTFGRKEVVEKALTYALGPSHGIDIRTPADFGVPDGSGGLGDKNTQLAALSQQYNMAASQIILVDDDKQNTDAAERAGVVVCYTPQGLTKPVTSLLAHQIGPTVYAEMKRLDGVNATAAAPSSPYPKQGSPPPKPKAEQALPPSKPQASRQETIVKKDKAPKVKKFICC